MHTETGSGATAAYAPLPLAVAGDGFYTLGSAFDSAVSSGTLMLTYRNPLKPEQNGVVPLSTTKTHGTAVASSIFITPGDAFEFKVSGTSGDAWTARFWLYEGTDLA